MSDHVFSIDLGRCTGCYACAIACKDGASLPDEGDWLRVKCEEEGSYPQPKLIYRIVHCFHCANPSCIPACPADAIARQPNGLVQINTQACVGCGACVDACPFGAVYMLPKGIATKCDGCADQLAQREAPRCVRACPMRALTYGPVPETPLRRTRDASFDDHNQEPAVIYWRWE